jgi:hypothetical protein
MPQPSSASSVPEEEGPAVWAVQAASAQTTAVARREIILVVIGVEPRDPAEHGACQPSPRRFRERFAAS